MQNTTLQWYDITMLWTLRYKNMICLRVNIILWCFSCVSGDSFNGRKPRLEKEKETTPGARNQVNSDEYHQYVAENNNQYYRGNAFGNKHNEKGNNEKRESLNSLNTNTEEDDDLEKETSELLNISVGANGKIVDSNKKNKLLGKEAIFNSYLKQPIHNETLTEELKSLEKGVIGAQTSELSNSRDILNESSDDSSVGNFRRNGISESINFMLNSSLPQAFLLETMSPVKKTNVPKPNDKQDASNFLISNQSLIERRTNITIKINKNKTEINHGKTSRKALEKTSRKALEKTFNKTLYANYFHLNKSSLKNLTEHRSRFSRYILNPHHRGKKKVTLTKYTKNPSNVEYQPVTKSDQTGTRKALYSQLHDRKVHSIATDVEHLKKMRSDLIKRFNNRQHQLLQQMYYRPSFKLVRHNNRFMFSKLNAREKYRNQTPQKRSFAAETLHRKQRERQGETKSKVREFKKSV